ncbi:MAG: phytanoyl-CoA dioxygenase family protein [Cyanobacteriota bacterium]|nr:phytanoyl-CoA dioxygenase family protein [Cyanobacteriota bacterium]
MILTLAPSAEEHAQQAFSEATLLQAYKSFSESGGLVLEEVFSVVLIERLYDHFVENYRSYFEDKSYADALLVGHKRLMITVDLVEPFHDPLVYANPWVYPLIQKILGAKFILNGFGAVIALPGSHSQHIHRDLSSLFLDDMADAIVPCYALNVIIPLVDLTERNGTTRIWPGSHTRYDQSVEKLSKTLEFQDPLLKRGSCLLIDYRLIHSGLGNTSGEVRPIFYNTYSRPWFRDPVNYKKQPGVMISAEALSRVPKIYQDLFAASSPLPSLG